MLVVDFSQSRFDLEPNADAEADFLKAVAHDDFRFIGVDGYVGSYPVGVSNDQFDLTQRYCVKTVNGTSDMIEGERDAKFQEAAGKYAERYNTFMLRYLMVNPPSKLRRILSRRHRIFC